ncbi:hypothetical protein J2127_000238 [Methanococcus voltae]|uniref:DUF2096 family protein n=1 Tax=Methanococcus voltae TaxID=2188 RepID=UPI001AE87BD4|nr:DUF2096 family protein [Methanococcus voltae]MBP2143097.1 hypothetical protein [Methanococcus voltae]
MKDAKGIDKKWVVLNNLTLELSRKRPIPKEYFDRLRIANNIITYYILDEHADFSVLMDAEKEISVLQGALFGMCDEKMAKDFLDKLGKASRGELDVEFPLKQTPYNPEVKKRKATEVIRVKMPFELHPEILGELSEDNGLIFSQSEEEDLKILIEGEKSKIMTALKDLAVIWKFNSLN